MPTPILQCEVCRVPVFHLVGGKCVNCHDRAELNERIAALEAAHAAQVKTIATLNVELEVLRGEARITGGELATLHEEVRKLRAQLKYEQREAQMLVAFIPSAHYCDEWDQMLIHDGMPEYEACICNGFGRKS